MSRPSLAFFLNLLMEVSVNKQRVNFCPLKDEESLGSSFSRVLSRHIPATHELHPS